jgi:hypothetical protein
LVIRPVALCHGSKLSCLHSRQANTCLIEGRVQATISPCTFLFFLKIFTIHTSKVRTVRLRTHYGVVRCVVDPDPEGSEIICKLGSGIESLIIFLIRMDSDSNPDPSQLLFSTNKHKIVEMYRFLKISFFVKFR